MDHRRLGSTDYDVSAVGFGGWAIGADWGDVSDEDARAAIHAAIDAGVTFFDTADVYGDGRSERRIAAALADLAPNERERIVVATKAGRRLDPHVADGYTYDNLARFVSRSRENLGVESLDLVQLHCPPTEVYRADEAFDALERLEREGAIRHHGVSVETVEEANLALEHEGVASVQIIYNPFRIKPALAFFPHAREKDVGVIVRVPLASGLLTGKYDLGATFPEDDHRNYNRHGEAFDVGETFAGVDFETGLRAASELASIRLEGATLAQTVLRWILQHPAVSTVIPGVKNADQARENAAAADLPRLPPAAMQQVRDVYDRYIRDAVHDRW